MENKYEVVIIGGGPGGYAAALYCSRANLKTVVLEKFSPGGQMATTSQIDNYPGFEYSIDGFDLGEKMQQGAERFGVKTEFAEVLAVDFSSKPKVLKTTEGDVYADGVIIATGANPKTLNLPREGELEGNGIAYCSTCDGMLYKDKIVVVAGGGNSAAGDSLFLSKICKKVYLVYRSEEMSCAKSYIPQLERAGNIEQVKNCKITEIIGEKRVTGVKLENKKTGEAFAVECSGLFVAIGRIPNTWLFKDVLDLDKDGYIIADETTRTNIPGVFAVGDLRTKPLRQIITAASDGAVASKYVEEYISTL